MGMRLQDNSVLVLGAGFTKAFFPNAPLLVDDWGLDRLQEKLSGLQHVQKLLDEEIRREGSGVANLERLFTRVTSTLPYETGEEVEAEYRVLRSELKTALRARLESVRDSTPSDGSFYRLAEMCVKNRIDCVTFNYDDTLDRALWEVEETLTLDEDQLFWHPDGGYGFYCAPAYSTVRGATGEVMDEPTNLLLKLHGSLNWEYGGGNLDLLASPMLYTGKIGFRQLKGHSAERA